jgi:excisionase family DNA binding protein
MMAVTELERFYSVEEIAERLQVSDQTVRRWVKSGKLAAFKPGKELRIRPSDLEEFLESRKVHPGEDGS